MIIKLFLAIDQKEQKKRFKKLMSPNPMRGSLLDDLAEIEIHGIKP